MPSAGDRSSREGRERRIAKIILVCALSRWGARVGLSVTLILANRVAWAVEGERDASVLDARDPSTRLWADAGVVDAGAADVPAVGAVPRADGTATAPTPRVSAAPPSSVPPPSSLRSVAPPPPVRSVAPSSVPPSPPEPPSPVDGTGGSAPYRSIVTARRIAVDAPREDRAASATVLTPADSPRARDDLGALLLEVPGANVTRQGGFGALATLSLRGSNPDEVRVYVDGIPLNQAVGGAVDLSTLPLGDVERVEVYRGSTPIGFGESALGGVVSISTRTPGTTNASARVGAGSFRTTFADATAGGAWGPVRVYVGVHALHALGNYPQAAPVVTGGYQPPERENNDLSQMDGVVRGVVSLPGRRELRAGLIAIWRDQGLPASDIFRSSARAQTTRLLAHVDYESRADLGPSSRLRAAVFGSRLRDAFSDPLHQIVGVATETHDLTRSIGARATAEKAPADWARLTALVEARTEEYLPRNDADPATAAGYPATRQVATAGLELDTRWPRLKLDLLPSARLETSHDVRTGRDMFGAERAPGAPIDRALPILRLGVLRSFDGGALRANVGRYARIPSFLELYGYNRGILGNPELRPERGVNADLGGTLERDTPGGRLLASLTVFGAEVNDLIAWETFSTQTRALNISRARIWGVEVEARARLRRLTLVTQATLTDARDEGNIAATRDRQIPHHPRQRGYARAEWRQPLPKAFVVSAYADLDASAGDSTASAYGALPPRALFGAGLGAEATRVGLRLAVSAFNLGDSRVNDFPDYPLPGRSFFMSLGWSGAGSTNVPSTDPQE